MIGDLNQRAALLARVMTPDGGGGFSESWQTIASAWAALRPDGASASFGADATQSRVRYRIVLRRYSLAADAERVAIGARSFRVLSVLDPGPQAEFVTLICEELP